MTRVERIIHHLELEGWKVVRHKRHTVLKLGDRTMVLSKTPRSVDDLVNIARQLARRVSSRVSQG